MSAVKLSTVRTYALSLPEVTEQPHFHFGSYRVRGKIFVTVPPQGDHIHLFVPEPLREQALAMYPACVEKLLWGGKVVGLRVAVATAPPAVVKQWLRAAWAAKAPKALQAQVLP